MDEQKASKRSSRIQTNENGEPLCRKCLEGVRLELTKRSTGVKYFWGYCRDCENKRQAYGRLRRTPIETKSEDIGLSPKVVEILAEAKIWTIRDLMDEDFGEIAGVGPKSVEAVTEWIASQKALDW